MSIIKQNIARKKVVTTCKESARRKDLETSFRESISHVAGIGGFDLLELLDSQNITSSSGVVDDSLRAVRLDLLSDLGRIVVRILKRIAVGVSLVLVVTDVVILSRFNSLIMLLF